MESPVAYLWHYVHRVFKVQIYDGHDHGIYTTATPPINHGFNLLKKAFMSSEYVYIYMVPITKHMTIELRDRRFKSRVLRPLN